ncbi:MAG TPA: class I SAM-dependent methyltransferase [Acidobacteriota bacterium]|nr:class I SAM-dependent methyltransferase [Acidobacteriota bacterium]HQG92366.1 class I SAM-dependent methyltransferase [Acidobacteriota bacterium]
MNRIVRNCLWCWLLLTVVPADFSHLHAGKNSGGGLQAASNTDTLTEHREQMANEFQPPGLVMDLLGVRPGLVIGEVGAGRGRVTVHPADRVGDKGKVYANDINAASLEYLQARCRRLGLDNVETILSRTDDACFPKEGRMLTRESVGREAREAGFVLDAVIEDKLKEDNIFILRPAVPDVPASNDSAKVHSLAPGALEPENENEARLNRLQPPDRVLDAVGVAPGQVVAEIGAGRGRYAVQLAARVGVEGRVYAEDIDSDALKYLRSRCERWNIRNVETVLGEVNNPKLPPDSLDLIFIISSFHHFDDPVPLIRNARKALKHSGKLAIVEWAPRPDREYLTPEQMAATMKRAGFALARTETFLLSNGLYIYIFRQSFMPGSESR